MSDTERGLYPKYEVSRLNDKSGKHDGCWYFVLDLDHDKHALSALAAYALSCREEYPLLSNDLWAIITDALDNQENEDISS